MDKAKQIKKATLSD